ncbi:uncharacterized protein LOC106092783 [Stomoxys calcitrans]|uniref:Uncharacterized protein n=1 Tax=Stomoxys calcitrans TaxID=35570 RepID=A0A1I8PQW8_STOCA|nr:uncharacterized protein LOC106092783 [Stomoxys calcitrans]XP_059226870.1 uncharacterized protein LOC106092783 [Stomoxys calcitrans]
MGNSGVNSGFAKCFILFMALIILLQGCVYLGLSIWGIAFRECSKSTTDLSQESFKFATYLIYFLTEDCGYPEVTNPLLNDPSVIHVNWEDSEVVTNREFIFMIVYAAISALWIVTSLLVITTICGPVTKIVRGLCFWPWFLVIIAGSILDVVATGFHIHDIVHTTSVENTFEYLGLSAAPGIMDMLENFDAYFVTPAVVMTCISSRIVLIWLLNIFGSSFCLSLSSALAKRNTSTKSSVTSANTTSTAPVTIQQEQPTREVQVMAVAAEIQSQQRSVSPEPRDSQLIRPKPLIIQNPSTTSINRQSSMMTPQNNRPYELQSPTAPPPTVYTPTNEPVTYRNTESHPDRLNYPTQQQPKTQLYPTPQLPKTPVYHEELSTISPLNSRYANSESFSPQPQQNQRISEELRGQLPWSYTSIPPPTPKKPQMHVYPEIPEPDYGH